MNGINVLLRVKREIACFHLVMIQDLFSLELRRGPSSEPNHADSLVPDLQLPKLGEIMCYCLQVYYSLYCQPKQNDMYIVIQKRLAWCLGVTASSAKALRE